MSSIAEGTLQGNTPFYTLFDSNAVAAATILGTPVAGSSLMALNYRRLGQAGKAVMTLAVGIIVTGLVILIGWNLPRGVTYPIGLALLIGTRWSAKSLQGAAVKDHALQGGRLGSNWAAFGVGASFLAALFAVVFLILFIPDIDRTGVVIGSNDEVYYSGSATKQEAQSLGNALKTSGYFSGKGANVFLAKGKNGTIVSFVVKDGFWDEPGIVSSFEEIGRQIAPVVGGFPVQLRLVNSDSDIKKESTVGRVGFAGNDDVYYFGAASEAEAQAFGQALKADGFFQGRGSDVFLSKHSDGTVLSFVVGKAAWENPAYTASFEKIVRQAVPAVGGLPVKLRLINTSLEVKMEKVVK